MAVSIMTDITATDLPQADSPWTRSRVLLPSIGALIVGLGLTFAVYQSARHDNDERAAQRFQTQIVESRQAIVGRMANYAQVLRSGVALFDTGVEVTRVRWRDFVEGLRVTVAFPGIQGVGWSVLIKPEDLAAHVAAVKAEGFPAYSVRPEGRREVYSAIVYLEPFGGRNLAAFGYDMLSEQTRRSAMALARDTGRTTASGKVTLVQEIDADRQAGFLMYLPVYRKGAVVSGVAERRDSIVGYVYSPFRMNDLMEGILGSYAGTAALRIFDGAVMTDDNLMYDSHRKAAPDTVTTTHRRVESIQLADRLWTVEFRSTAAFDRSIDRTAEVLALLAGSLASLLLAAFVWAMAQARTRALALANEMTADLKASEAQLRTAMEAAQAASRAKSEFISTVSHELRTPLTSIRGALGLIAGGTAGALEPRLKQMVEVASRNASRLSTLVNDILDLQKIEAGQFDFSPTPIDLDSLVRQAVEGAADYGRQFNVGYVVTENAPGLKVKADAERIIQVLNNLLSNAAKFSNPGQTVEIAVACKGAQARVAVTDHGQGIPPEFHGQVFNRFAQADSSDTRKFGGTGLGLAISKAIIDAHGGSIGFESQLGLGTKFWIELGLAD
ncbi:MAG: hypothetical protein FJX46_15375 [Alphaproteobacteria bacterium]|nr:hypothetical protein [Alphaproteobacteria bacterium]